MCHYDHYNMVGFLMIYIMSLVSFTQRISAKESQGCNDFYLQLSQDSPEPEVNKSPLSSTSDVSLPTENTQGHHMENNSTLPSYSQVKGQVCKTDCIQDQAHSLLCTQ